MFFYFLFITCTSTYKTSLLFSINNQYLTVLLCWEIYLGLEPWFYRYSKLIVQFQELVEIIDIKYPLSY